MKRKITFLHLFLLNHLVLTVIILGVVGAYGTYLVTQEQRALRERIEPVVSSEVSRLKSEFFNLERNLQKLKSVVQMFDYLPPAMRKKIYSDFAAETIASYPMEYNAWLALSADAAKKYFNRDSYVVTIHRNASLEGNPKYMEPSSFVVEQFDSADYLTNPENEWWAINKKFNQGVNYTDFYFDKGYMEKVMFTSSMGIYQDGELRAVVGIDVLTSEIAKRLADFKLGKTGGAFIVDETGRLVLPLVSMDVPMLGARYNRATTPSQFKTMPRYSTKAIDVSGSDIQDFVGADSEEYVTLAKPLAIKGHNWFLAVYQKKSEAYSVMYGKIFMLLASVFVAYLLGSLTLFFTGRYVILREKRAFEELLKSRDRAQAATKAKSVFLSTMSHEIRTPLNAMLGSADLLNETRLSGEQQEYVNSLMSAGESLLSVVNDILDFSKIEAGKMSLENKEYLLSELVRETELLVMPSIYRKGLQFHVHYPKLDAKVRGDALRVKQVLLNLIGNAVKFTDQGSVELSVRIEELADPAKRRIHFDVKDTGIGIARENMETIFDEFRQEDSSVTRRFGGTGLGLSISKKIVELMDGQMSCRSTQYVGSTFSFYVDSLATMQGSWIARPEEYHLMPMATANSLAEEAVRTKRILLVDDMEENHQLLKAYMKSFKHIEIHSAFNGIECLEKCLEHSYDLIFMDVQMPKISGLDTIRRLREMEKQNGLPRVPVIVVSANNFTEDREKSLAVGADEHCGKPIRKRTILELIAKYCAEEPQNLITN